MSPTIARLVAECRATTEATLLRAFEAPLGAERARTETRQLLVALEDAVEHGTFSVWVRSLAERVAAWEASGVSAQAIEDVLGELARWPWLRESNHGRSEGLIEEALRRERDQRTKLGALLTASRAVVSSLDLQTILATIVHQIRLVIPADECTVLLVDDETQVLVPAVHDAPAYVDEVMAVRLRMGEGITGSVALAGRGEIVNDAHADPRAHAVPGMPQTPTSLLCAPLVSRDRVLGVITLNCARRDAFEPGDLELATLFADQCSAAIANARLYDSMKQAYDEVRAAQAKLVQAAKLNALGEMAGGVAHDFNNILATILGRTQLLMQHVTDPEVRQALGVIEQAACNGAQTVRRVQEFTRVRQDERFETIDLNRVIESVVELTRPVWEVSTKKRDVKVRLHLDLQARQTIAGTSAELNEVFTNIVLNAVDAMPLGGDLWIASRDEGHAVCVEVRDSGVGMDADTQARIFDPFFTTKEEKGTGLGLSVAYGIVTRHRGHIEVHSAPGEGATFTLTFPVGATEAAPVETSTGAPRALRILVADDEESVLSVLTEMLRGFGHTVVPAHGGPEAIEQLRHRPFDVVFTDLGMPEVNGWDLAAAAKARDPECAVVLVSGWGFQLEEESTLARGVDQVLPKPFMFEDVENVLSTLFTPEGRRRIA